MPQDHDAFESAQRERIEDKIELDELEPDLYQAKYLWVPENARGAFGGQIQAQAVWACTLSTPEQFALHSMHCYFLASVSKKAPLHYKVTRLRDGRGFCVRNVVGIQNGKNVIAVSASFQVPESSPVEVDNFPRLPVAAASTSEPTFGSTDAVLRPQARDVSLKPTGFRFGGVELRSAVLTDNGKTHDDAVYTWIRVARTDNRGRAMQKCILIYLGDVDFLPTAPHALGVNRSSDPLRLTMLASLDHAQHFLNCDSVDLTEWILFQKYFRATTGGRCLCQGTMYTQNGTVISTMTQEGLLRLRDTGAADQMAKL